MSERQQRQRQATIAEIKATAWAQIAGQGGAALSLRAVAQAMGLSAPALYRYFPSKNHLVTALVIDAFASLAAAQERENQHSAGRDWRDRLRGLGRCYRDWAMGQPAAFYLIFGNPVPGYQPPWSETMPVAASSLAALIAVLEAARLAGTLRLPLAPPAPPALSAALADWNGAQYHTDPDILYLAFTVAARVQGLMLVELGGQLPPFFADGRELFERELERIVRELEN